MTTGWRVDTVMALQREGILLVEDGNHGENRPLPDEFVSEGVAFIRAADMDAGRVLFDAASRINATATKRIVKGIGRPEDVLLSHKGTVGKVAFVRSDAPAFVCSPQTTFWRALNRRVLDPTYLYAYLRSPGFHEQLRSRAGETDMAPYVSLTSQRTLTVAIPPLHEQRAIARILGALDDKIELNRRTNETLEAMARALFKSWFVDFDPVRAKMEGRVPAGMDAATAALFPNQLANEIPVGWRNTQLEEIMEVHDSKRIPLSSLERASHQGSFPYHGATSVMDWVDDYLFDGVHVLVGEDGSVINDDDTPVLQYVWGKFWVNNHAHVLRARHPLTHEHLLLTLKHVNIRSYVTGAVQPKLNQGNLARVPVLLASPAVCLAFGKLIGSFYSQIRHTTEESRTLAALRDALLPRLLSGELRVSDAEHLAERAL